MPTLTVDNFKIGVDLRRGKNVSDANRLRHCINAIVTNGGAIEKRGGLDLMYRAQVNSVGLASHGDTLTTFALAAVDTLSHPKTNLEVQVLRRENGTPPGGYAYATPYDQFDEVTWTTDTKLRQVANVTAQNSQAAPTVWSAAATPLVGDRYVPTDTTDYENIVFYCTTAGTTGGTEPAWDIDIVGNQPPLPPSIDPSTTTDNTVVWEARYIFNPGIGEFTEDDNGLEWMMAWRSPKIGFGVPKKLWFSDTLSGNQAVIVEDSKDDTRLFYIDGELYKYEQTAQVNEVGTLSTWYSGDIHIAKPTGMDMLSTRYGTVNVVGLIYIDSLVVGGQAFFIVLEDVGEASGIDSWFDLTIENGSQPTYFKAQADMPQGFRLSFSGAPLGTEFPGTYTVFYITGDPQQFGNNTPGNENIDITVDYQQQVFLPNEVTDLGCPLNATSRTPSGSRLDNPAAVKLSDRLFIADKEEVVFSALVEPDDWSDADDSVGAGSLAAGRQASGGETVRGLGDYQGKLIVGFEDSSQSWNIDADSALNSFDQTIDAVGSRFPRSYSNISGDTFFLSSSGVRSIALLSLTNNLADVDVGTAIDDLIKLDIDSDSDPFDPVSMYNAKEGQWQIYIEKKAYVYTFSRTAKISAWSQFEFANDMEYAVRHKGEVFLRDEFRGVYFLNDEKYIDDTMDNGGIESEVAIDVDVQMAYLDFKKPGELKYIKAFDVVCDGECEVSFLYEYEDDNGNILEAETDSCIISKNTRPGDLYPIEITAVSIAPRFRSTTDTQALRIDAVSIYYETLGAMQ